ncbi:hypothetical protein [Rosenbergiella nectarea]|uniref:hypothetical protein n=1 Tax=Rosenbergiella nectarea TaxID=988801 RepID=UPI001BDAC6D0|nr:hypothetical protein [Rosenbergiella nectarea]MBT0729556.1 hypothetical protein [Rosenbergiella nectarea subsp. apis]
MIALTQEKREELVSSLTIYIRTTETAIKAGLATEEDLFNLEVRKIALASLIAEPVMVNEDFHDAASGIIDGRFHRCGRSVTLEKVGIYEQEKMHPVYLSPPVPEIKLPSAELIKEVFLANGFKEKVQIDGSNDLNMYVYDAVLALFERLNGWGE